MMFMIGQGERVVPVGEPEPQHCPRCDETRDFQPQVAYKYGEFDLLFGFVYGRRYQLACPECHHGWRLDRRQAEQRDVGASHERARIGAGCTWRTNLWHQVELAECQSQEQ